MRGFVNNIEDIATDNDYFRCVLYTGRRSQLVVMSLKPGEEIGEEVHQVDQFFRVEEGDGEAIIDGYTSEIEEGFAVLIPAGARHNIRNTSDEDLKLYTIYAPPHHRDGVIPRTRAEAEADKEQFTGETTE